MNKGVDGVDWKGVLFAGAGLVYLCRFGLYWFAIKLSATKTRSVARSVGRVDLLVCMVEWVSEGVGGVGWKGVLFAGAGLGYQCGLGCTYWFVVSWHRIKGSEKCWEIKQRQWKTVHSQSLIFPPPPPPPQVLN